MEKNHLIELIKQNRLKEAIELMEDASEGTPIYNQMIMLSSTFSEYTRLNRSATHDFETLEMQRKRIANTLMEYLDEMPQESLQRISSMVATSTKPQPSPAFFASPAFASSSATPAKSSQPVSIKGIAFGAAGVILLIILLVWWADDSPSESPQESSTPTFFDAGEAGASDEGLAFQAINYVAYQSNSASMELAIDTDDGSWSEYQDDTHTFSFREMGRNESSVAIYLRDESRDINLYLDLANQKIWASYGADPHWEGSEGWDELGSISQFDDEIPWVD